MSKKKLTNFSELGGFVFSTDENFQPEAHEENDSDENFELEAHYSSKGRSGKPVTLIKGFKGTSEKMKELATYLKNSCGVGGSVKEGVILIQGKNRDKIIQLLAQKGYSVKRIGG